MSISLKVIDLFAGIGGFSLGFIRSNSSKSVFSFDLSLLADIDTTAAYTFKKNYPKIPYWVTDLSKIGAKDILNLPTITRNSIDFVIGGPPCQGFSSTGTRLITDKRNELLFHFIRIALDLQPKCIIIENVPLLTHIWTEMMQKEISQTFTGYNAKAQVLNAAEFGVPQRRKRLFIVALRNDLGIDSFNFPEGDHNSIEWENREKSNPNKKLQYISVAEAIGDLPSLKAGQSCDGKPYDAVPISEYQKDRRIGSIGVFNHVARAHSKEFLKKLSVIKPGKGNSDLPADKKFSDNYYSQAYGRLHSKGIAFTITANFRNPGSGRFLHYRDRRSITVREAARLQSFDDKYIFHGYETDQERHVGNAVPPLLSEALANHFGSTLTNGC